MPEVVSFSAMPLNMTIDRLNPSSAVVTIHGALTLGTNLRILEANVQQLIGEGVQRLVLDLSDCNYADSAGLGFLIHTYGLVVKHSGTMRLCGLQEQVAGLLKMTQTESFLICDANREASLERI